MVYLQLQKEMVNDENKWWNKLVAMSKEELELLPYSFMKKYGAYVHFMRRMGDEARLDENRSLDYYGQIKSLNKLQTEDERSLMIKEFRKSLEPDVVTMDDLEEEKGDYMKRQPRVDLDKLSYNFEQFDLYSSKLC